VAKGFEYSVKRKNRSMTRKERGQQKSEMSRAMSSRRHGTKGIWGKSIKYNYLKKLTEDRKEGMEGTGG
jgi:hypothetical protein